MIVRDFNSHSETWGSYKLDQRGQIIEDSINLTDVILLNKKEPTHFNNSYNRSSAIDLSITNTSAAHKFQWTTSHNLYGSDHYQHAICRWKRHPTTENKTEQKKLRAIMRNTFKEASKQSWIEYTTTITSTTTLSATWNKIKKIMGTELKYLQTKSMVHDNITFTEPVDMANVLAQKFT